MCIGQTRLSSTHKLFFLLFWTKRADNDWSFHSVSVDTLVRAHCSGLHVEIIYEDTPVESCQQPNTNLSVFTITFSALFCRYIHWHNVRRSDVVSCCTLRIAILKPYLL